MKRGAVLLATLVCLFLASLLIGGWFALLTRLDRQTRLHQRHLQAEVVADAAVRRAALRLAAAPDYAGETWTLDEAACLHLGERIVDADVSIRVESEAKTSAARRVTIEVRFPSEGDQLGRVIREVTIP